MTTTRRILSTDTPDHSTAGEVYPYPELPAEYYERWIETYQHLLARHESNGDRLADLGCGTGRATIRWAELGYTPTGVDSSAAAVHCAERQPGADRARFVTGDLRHLPRLGPFDIALTMGDPLSYLLDADELLAAFRCVATILRPGGLFLFDLNTTRAYGELRNFFYTDDSTEGTVAFVRGTESDRDSRAANVDIDKFTTRDGHTWHRLAYRVVLSYFPAETVLTILDEAGLEYVQLYGIRLNPEEEPVAWETEVDENRDHRMLFVSRKPAETN